MTNFIVTHKLNDLEQVEGGQTPEEQCRSFCQCIHNLVGGRYTFKTDSYGWAIGRFYDVDDDKFQSIEVIIEHTLWGFA